ncbi:Protein M3 [Mortierella sp. AM989]|nr:Protein M3 [Mortierella sp. AM989]
MAKHGLLTPAGAKVVAGLILNYTLPALLFAKMVTCVNQDNVEELGFVALIAVLYIVIGAVLGLMIQRTGLVPKRLYWGIVAATMFTNFGDLPISIILAVSDHPPFLVGDGARGTAYSSVFISVFYLFLFPLGGYRLIRYDHVKETKRLQNLTTLTRENNNNGLSVHISNASDCTLSDNTPVADPSRIQQQQFQQNQYLLSLGHHPVHSQQQEQTLQPSFSATSTMISMDCPAEDNAKELRYRPCDYEKPVPHMASPPQTRHEDSALIRSSSPPRATNPFIHTPKNSNGSCSSGSGRSSPTTINQNQVSYPLRTLSSDGLRYSVDSMVSNGTGATRFSASHEDDHNLIRHAATGMGPMGKKSLRSPIFKSYQPPPLHPSSISGASSSNPSGTTPSSLLGSMPPTAGGIDDRMTGNPNGTMPSENMVTVPLESISSETISMEPLPKVPPALQNSYDSKHRDEVHWVWRIFHSTREYLTPPTIGLILGLMVALSPLRGLFVSIANPFPSPDELPPLSFILEVTVMLGGCCVPLGLTVLGASLSRLKPGRMRPLIPVMTMITVAKLVITPMIGIMLTQFVLVRQLGWISAQNHILQFTLMLSSGTPTSITCFVLAQVWDRRTKNAGSEMAALIAVQYAVSIVSLTIGSAFMMYYLF